MRSSVLIYATCFVVAGCSAQLRFPSLSSTLSSLAGIGGNQAATQSAGASAYSGFVRDYGRNLMAAMSSIYPTLFKPPQQPQQQAGPPQQAAQSPFESAFGTQFAQNLFSSPSSPSFSFGGSSYSIPSFNSLSGNQAPSSSAFGSFGSPSISASPSFAPISSASFIPQQGPSFAPPSSYNAAFEAANGRPIVNSQPAPSFSNINSLQSNQPLLTQTSNSVSSFASLPQFGQQDSSIQSGPQLAQSANHYTPHGQQGPQLANPQFRYPSQGPINSVLPQYTNSHQKT